MQFDKCTFERLKAGDQVAWRKLYTDQYEAFLAIARCNSRDWSDAEDALAEAFLIAFRKIDQVREPRSFIHWMGKIIRREARKKLANRLGRSKKEVPLGNMAEELAQADVGKDTQDVRWDLEWAIARLPEIHRDVVSMIVTEGMKYREAAELLEIPIGTVKSRLHEAVRKLADELGSKRTESTGHIRETSP